MFSTAKFALILFALPQVLKFMAWRHPHFAARLKERNLVAQIKARDEGTGRWIELRDGKIRSGAGLHAKPDITLAFKNAATGAVAADAADQLAQPDQCAKGFCPGRRRA